jgi:hypothetical protein
MFTYAEDVDVHGSAGEPFAQAIDQRLMVTLTEFRDHLGNSALCEVTRQTGDNPFLDIFSGPAAVTKSDVIHG